MVLPLRVEPAQRPLATTVTEVLLSELSNEPRLEALGESELAALVGIERQRQLLGCSEESTSCLLEAGGAMDVPYLLTGSLGRLDPRLRLDLKVLSVRESRVVARAGTEVDSPDQLGAAATRLLRDLLPSMLPTAPRAPVLPKVVTALGAGLAVVGMVGVVSAHDYDSRKLTLTYDQALVERARAQGLLTASGWSIGVGLAVAAAGGFWWYRSTPAPPPASVTLLPSEGGLVLSGQGRF